MKRAATAAALAERMDRPQRIGVFGHRGVGKTTLLTMLYREAVGGRLPSLRLAAGDTRTAEYLAEKILQLEAGTPLPGTLAETDLRLHLYHQGARLDLLVKDYQGEQVELGRHGPIRDFLRDCDAVWLCLDVSAATDAERLRRQQEIEQLVEEYLAVEPTTTLERPIALLFTKSDQLTETENLEHLAADAFGMTAHALRSHCPTSGSFAVSALGGQLSPEALQPHNLEAPLTWLATALGALDEARLERLWDLARGDVAVLQRGIAALARRAPDSPVLVKHRQRLRELRWVRRRCRVFLGAATAAALLVGLWSYDAIGHREATRFEADHADQPAAALEQWRRYRDWHPTRNVLGVSSQEAEDERLRTLAGLAHDRARDAALTDLRREAGDADADAEAVWRRYQEFRGHYPEVSVQGDLERLRSGIKSRRDSKVRDQAVRAYDELTRAGSKLTDLMANVERADRWLRDFGGQPQEADVRQRRAAALQRLDEQDIHGARDYSARQPLNFQTRNDLYQRYLDRHPAGGACTAEAKGALKTIAVEWDRHDFRALRDHFVANPGDTAETVVHCRRYLAVHPAGQFRGAATELLRWTERVTVPGEYSVTLMSGTFDPKMAYWVSRGLKLSVELEVAGVRYGPSTIVKNTAEPQWNFEFPRKVRWKLGDPVKIRVNDHTWRDRVVVEIASENVLGMSLLSGEASVGANSVRFASDFALPKLPTIE